jgi:hypothetical protein
LESWRIRKISPTDTPTIDATDVAKPQPLVQLVFTVHINPVDDSHQQGKTPHLSISGGTTQQLGTQRGLPVLESHVKDNIPEEAPLAEPVRCFLEGQNTGHLPIPHTQEDDSRGKDIF